MHTLTRKVLALAGLVLLSAPAFASDTLPFGMNADQADAAKVQASSSQLGSLIGRYTFLATGALVGPNFISRKTTTVGSLVFDGKGSYSGTFDTGEARGIVLASPVSGTYTLGANGVGTLSFAAVGSTFQFSLSTQPTTGTVQNATLVESDNVAGIIGYLKKETIPTSLDGSYNFDLTGETVVTSGVPNAVAVGGTLTIAQGAIQGNATFFVGEAAAGTATVVSNISFPGTITVPDVNGRFIITLELFSSSTPTNFVGYIVDPTHFYLMAIDSPSVIAPLLAGSAIR